MFEGKALKDEKTPSRYIVLHISNPTDFLPFEIVVVLA